MPKAWLRNALLASLAMSAGGCGLSEAGPCTLIGCEGGLLIRLAEPTSGPVVVRAALSDGTVLEGGCAGEVQCGAGVFFADVTAPTAVLEVEMNGELVTRAVALTYIELRPNGPDCPPPCPVATVILAPLG